MTKNPEISEEALRQVFSLRYGDAKKLGWLPRRRLRFGYHIPTEYYEAAVRSCILEGTRWLDVGGGRDLFPHNHRLAEELARRCGELVVVDPSANVMDNPYAHERIQSRIEDYTPPAAFDLITLRMVAEHIQEPERVAAAFERLLEPGGRVIIYTVNARSPITWISRLVPFRYHHPIKRLFWGGEERDTFPVAYKMNTRARLAKLFGRHGFEEEVFLYLDDCTATQRFPRLNWIELWAWRGLSSLGLRYPENCLLGVYLKSS